MARRTFSGAFAAAVKKRRHALGMSQEALADRAGIHRTHVSLIELDKRTPGIDVARAIAQALEVRLSTLIAEAENENS